MTSVKRSYHAPSRDAAAEETRRAIIRAAAELFLAQGYVQTTVAQIAERAKVSRPTVFAVGSKTDLFALVRDQTIAGDEAPVPVIERRSWRRLLAAPDQHGTLRAYAKHSADINRRYSPLHEVLRRSAAAAPEMAELYERSERERRVGVTAVLNDVRGKGALAVAFESAVDIVWVLNATDNYYRLVHDRDWPHARYQRWLAEAMIAALVRKSG